MARPTTPYEIGKYLEYPQGSSAVSCEQYWLAAGGRYVRMTPKCKTALLASFEGVLERAVAPFNVGTSLTSYDQLISSDFVGTQNPEGVMAGPELCSWAEASYRNGIKDKLVRGCPKEDWDRFVRLTWDLWKMAGMPVRRGMNYFQFMGWQTWAFQLDTQGWITMGGGAEIPVPWCWDMSELACDEGWALYYQQEYAPWGTHKGPQNPNGRVTNWAIDAFTSMGGNPNAGSGSYMYLVGGDGWYTNGTNYLGRLDSGRLGNWTDGLSSTSDRRSSTGWSVFQSMLANLKYCHIMFGHSTDYNNTQADRIIQRYFYFDPADAHFYLADWDDYETSSTWRTTNYLQSGSYIDYMPGTLAVGLTFAIFKGEPEEQFILDAPPEDLTASVNAYDLLTEYRDQMGGLNEVEMYRYMTTSVVSSHCNVEEPYPCSCLTDMYTPNGASFIDCKTNGSAMNPGQISSYGGWTEDAEPLSAGVEAHANRMLRELTQPRAWAQPAPIDDAAVAAASLAWWDNWKIVYPDEPNWPPYEATQGTATQYFPVALENPNGIRKGFVEETDRWNCEHGGYFGNFELAFPDYPFGWANEDVNDITQWAEAVASYTWRFKALPAT